MRVGPLGPESRAGYSDGFVSCQLSQAGPTERECRLPSPQDHCRTRRGSSSQPFINPENGLPVRKCLHGVDRRGRPERACGVCSVSVLRIRLEFGLGSICQTSPGAPALGKTERRPEPLPAFKGFTVSLQPRTGQPGVEARRLSTPCFPPRRDYQPGGALPQR